MDWVWGKFPMKQIPSLINQSSRILPLLFIYLFIHSFIHSYLELKIHGIYQKQSFIFFRKGKERKGIYFKRFW